MSLAPLTSDRGASRIATGRSIHGRGGMRVLNGLQPGAGQSLSQGGYCHESADGVGQRVDRANRHE